MRILQHATFFSGIGGPELASEWMGWKNVFHCEINPFGRRVLEYYWKDSKSYEDITTTDFSIWRGKIDVLTGGFPCQPFSAAGKRKGTEDNRYLWKEMLRGIREIQPRWIVGENVRGLVNWSKGLVFEQIQIDLENEGYEVTPFLLPACGVNAPHKRERIFFIAYSNKCSERSSRESKRAFGKGSENNDEPKERGTTTKQYFRRSYVLSGFGNATDTDGKRHTRKEHRFKESRFNTKKNKVNGWENFPTQSPIRSGNDGIPTRLDGITFSKWRNESIKAYGNAIVPQVIYPIYKSIQEYENLKELENKNNMI